MNLFSRVLIILSIVLSAKLQAQWEYQQSGVTVSLRDVCFVDSLYGWCIGDSSTIIATNDGGQSWIKQISPDSSRKMNKIQFVDRMTGYIIGTNGLLLKTSNGGNIWQKMDSGVPYTFSDLSFVDENTGWISCYYEEPTVITGAILKTDDGGEHWTKQIEIIADGGGSGTPVKFISTSFINKNTGWALGSDFLDNFSPSLTYFTNDKGKTWNMLGGFDSPLLWNLKAIDKDTLWATGFIFSHSFDGGKTWLIPGEEGNHIEPIDISPINGHAGWVIHSNRFSRTINKILFTKNSGESWSIDLDLSYNKPNSITNMNGKYVWAVGDGGLIVKKTVGVSSIENDSGKEHPSRFTLRQNYPNPFNASTTFTYEIKDKTYIDLSIFNLHGQKLATLVSDNQAAGKYNVRWNAAELSSGIYFYKITDGTGLSQAKKLLLVK